jgi:hypothetical protein
MAQEYDTSVFINCPFDPEYRPLFEAVIFNIYIVAWLKQHPFSSSAS